MKAVSCITIGFIVFLITSCHNGSGKNEVSVRDSSSIRNCEIYKGDTCNRADWKGRKQGNWYFFDKKNHEITDTIYYKDGIEISKK
jgi:hypothetical protein